MKSIIAIIITVSIFLSSCTEGGQRDTVRSGRDSIIASMTKAKNSGEKVEGRFLNIYRIDKKTYTLSIQTSKDGVDVFETSMLLDETEISLLKKQGNNILLTYRIYQNPKTKKTVKIVQYMQPIYEFQKN